MSRLCRFMFILLFVAAQAGFSVAENAPESHPHEPFELVRSLHALQDQVAFGSRAALSAQRGLLLHIGKQLLSTAPEAWAKPVNARAAITYVLSGGQPELLRVLLAGGMLPAEENALAKAALAYATGRQGEALAGFSKVDARTLPPSLGAHVAVVQAALTMEAAPERAVEYLETARLLAPGTLVEESALRRHLAVASTLSDPNSFIFLARQYIRRFQHSIYAANFLRAFPELWIGLDLPTDEESFVQIDEALGELETDARREVHLSLARRAILGGDRRLARFAATRAAELSDMQSVMAVRAALYEAAAGVAEADSASAVQMLHEIDPAQLSEIDAELHSAALTVARQVQGPPVQKDRSKGVPGSEPTPVNLRARAAIEATDALLQRVR